MDNVRKVSSLEFMREVLKAPEYILHSVAGGLALILIFRQELIGQAWKGLLIILILWVLSAPCAWVVEVVRFALSEISQQ